MLDETAADTLLGKRPLAGYVVGAIAIAAAVYWGGGALFAPRPSAPAGTPSMALHKETTSMPIPENARVATFGAGCFWCVEAVFKELKGVYSVVSGYSGGSTVDPTYEEVCSGATGHAEVVQVAFDPEQIRFEELLEVFWKTHDPTTKNRQGPDVGTQYRSAIFYHDEEQRRLAEHYKERLNASGAFAAPIVTEISPYTAFYPAEAYHQDYYARNTRQPYCVFRIAPKLDKLRAAFSDKLKQDSATSPAR